MNRVDVVDLVVDLVDVGLDIDLVDVDLDVDLVDVGPVDVVGVGVVFVLFAPQKKSRGRKGTLAAGCPLDKANGRGHKSTLGKRGLSPHRNPLSVHLLADVACHDVKPYDSRKRLLDSLRFSR